MRKFNGAGVPFLKVIIPAGLGIVVSRLVVIPFAAILVACVVCFVFAWLTSRKPLSNIYVWFSILFFFLAAGTVFRSESKIPQSGRLELVAQIAENPYRRGRWDVTTANVGYYRSEGDSPDGWNRVDERIQLYVDTCYYVAAGRQIAFRGWVNPVDTTDNPYGRLMKLRGQHSRVFLVPGNFIRTAPHISKTPAYYASKLQTEGIARLSRLDMNQAETSVVTAMTVGDKRSVGRDLRAGYGITGAAHILAVSGMHAGIVFLLVNFVLYLLPAFRNGHKIKNVIAIVAIWLYAMMAGLSPSVVRAAMMFSFAQFALASGSRYVSLNIMLGSAVVMLAINPNYAGDPSFMLSYAAVLSIVVFFPPLYSSVRTRFKIVNVLTSTLIIGVVATLGTAPMVCYWFGNFPIVGMLINPLMILTAHIIVMGGVLWIIMPFPFLAAAFSKALGFAAAFQNSMVEWAASLKWASVQVNLPPGGVIAVYIAYIMIAVWAFGREGQTPIVGKEYYK